MRKVLVVDDDINMLEMLSDGLTSLGFQIETASNANSALELLRADPSHVLLTDLRLGPDDGLVLARRALEVQPELLVVVMTGFGSMEAAVGAIRAGAYDFVAKPVDLDGLGLVLERAVKHRELTSELRRLKRQVASRPTRTMIGESARLAQVQDLIARVAETDTTILVTGESGTGKEVVARALHDGSPRRDKPFVAINCAALPATLLESELFGHVKGAFTDARRDRAGLFVQANGGTLFLDEIGEMAPEMQAKLLRAVQEHQVRPVGGTQEIAFDTRIVAATNRDLEQQVEEGTFREDLYYRINVVRIKLPPLRARGHDILLLAQHFLAEVAQRLGKEVRSLSQPAAEKLLSYDWPGNVRELQNAMERAVALARFDQITVEDLPERIASFERARFVVIDEQIEDLPSLDELEARYIRRVMEMVGGNKSKAAEILGLGRSTLYRRLEKYAQAENE